MKSSKQLKKSQQQKNIKQKQKKQIQIIHNQIDNKRIEFLRNKLLLKDSQKTDQYAHSTVKMSNFPQHIRRLKQQFHQQNYSILKLSNLLKNNIDQNDKLFIIDQKKPLFTKGNKKSNIALNLPKVNYSLYTQLCSSMINYIFTIKDTYCIFPFKNESIKFQVYPYLNPKYLFHVRCPSSQKISKIKDKLEQLAFQDHVSQNSYHRILNDLDFYDYLDFFSDSEQIQEQIIKDGKNNPKNQKNQKQFSKQFQYPQQIRDISQNNLLFEGTQSQLEQYNNETPIIIEIQDNKHRFITCLPVQSDQLADCLYFDQIQDYIKYNQYRKRQFKLQKIICKDKIITTDIRSIISSEKIYLIEIIQQIKQYIKLSTLTSNSILIQNIYQGMKQKSNQYLHLLCGYTTSSILLHYNIDNYYQMIYQWIQKSIEYHKNVKQIDQCILKQYPVLTIWYHLPINLMGFTRDQLHQHMYDLVTAIIKFKEKIMIQKKYQELKIQKDQIQYY